MSEVRDELDGIGAAVKSRFEAQKRVLSFPEYLELLFEQPERYTRDASKYLKDCLDFFGSYSVDRAGAKARRFRVFDLDFSRGAENAAPALPQRDDDDPERREHLVGHEVIQDAFYRALTNFVREGRPNRLVLLHGPNGSAKSTFVQCVLKALEAYSARDEGALYRFSWIFPRGRDGKTMGFGSMDEVGQGGSYAHLPDAQIDAKLVGELREHPLHLIPLGERRKLLANAKVDGRPPEWVWSGQLGNRNQKIFDALLTAYRGDLRRVLDHVRVERYYISRRYRVGAVTIGPEMAVDASERQITADNSLSSLPASLAALTLFEPYGELVDAAGGVVEFSDLLKRPLDAWKYLLLAIENGEVSLPMSNLTLNSVMVASSNEVHLRAFRDHHDYNSFRGRLYLVRVPYLLDYTQEQGIYDAQIVPQVRRHVAPHTTFVAALWAVLSRLRRAEPDRLESAALGRIAADLSPSEKAELYAHGTVPMRLAPDDGRELVAHVQDIFREGGMGHDYEGLEGASPREIRGILLEAANDERYECLSPTAVLESIEAFCARNDHDFLKQTPDRGYHDHRGFVRIVRDRWLDRVDVEFRTASGLVDEAQYVDLFARYVGQVSLSLKGEKAWNPITGKDEEPDADVMEKVESALGVTKRAAEFRHELISHFAAHAIDHPGDKPDPAKLFPQHIRRMREAYYEEKRDQMAAILRDLLLYLDDAPLADDRKKRSATAFQKLQADFGYAKVSAKAALGELAKHRYG